MRLARSQLLTFLRMLLGNFWLQAALVFGVLVLCYLYWLAIENAHLLFGLYHDDAVYMVCAKALISGQGYRIESLPLAPWESKYPIGFSLFLSVLWLLLPKFPGSLIPLHTIMTMIGLLVALVGSLFLVCTRKTSLLCGAIFFAASVFNANFAETVPMILSDFTCGLLMLIGVWRTEILAKKKTCTTADSIILGILWAIPALVRLQGLGLMLAGSAYLLFKRRYSIFWKAFLVGVVLCLPDIIWQVVTARSAPDWYSFYTGYFPNQQNVHVSPLWWPVMFIGDFALNFSQFFFLLIPFLSVFFGLGTTNPVIYFCFQTTILFLLIVTFAGIFRLWRRKSILGIGGFCVGMPWLAVPIHIDIRYLLPALPILYYLLAEGLRVIGSVLKKPARRMGLPYRKLTGILGAFLAVSIIAAAAVSSLAEFTQDKWVREVHPLFISPQRTDSDYTYAFQWIHDHTKESDVFACNNGPVLYLYTGRRGLPPWHMDFFSGVVEQPKVPQPLEIFGFARPAYVMDDPLYRGVGDDIPSATGMLVIAVNDVFPGSLTEVFNSPHNFVRIYQVNYDKLPPDLSCNMPE